MRENRVRESFVRKKRRILKFVRAHAEILKEAAFYTGVVIILIIGISGVIKLACREAYYRGYADGSYDNRYIVYRDEGTFRFIFPKHEETVEP